MKGEHCRSPRLPGGDLVAALFNREVMMLADRGGASNIIGDRWADLAAADAATWVGGGRRMPVLGAEGPSITRIDRLDATPAIAAAASKKGLQNPDLLIIGDRDGVPIVQAADAKFSIETARSKQVSPDVVRGLLELRERIPVLLSGLAEPFDVEPGVFLSPDYPLTHLMLKRRHGIVRTTVAPHEVVLVPVAPERFWDGVEGASVMSPLESVDELPVYCAESLLAGVYYFRLARAVVGFWLDATKPLLLYRDAVTVDESAVREEAIRRARRASSAIEMVRQWDADVQVIRDQRAAVDQAAGLPVPGRELRSLTARIAATAGGEPPSSNQVRRRLGNWYRALLRERVGPLTPPVEDLPAVLREVSRAGRDLAPRAEEELRRVVLELMAEDETREAAPIAAL